MPSKPHPAKPEQHRTQGDAKPQSVAPVPKSARPSIYNPKCDAPKDHDEADLCVQAAMRDAAQAQNRISREQNWMSAAQAILFILTVYYTIKATQAAAASAKAAEDSVKIQTRAVEQQLRAEAHTFISFDIFGPFNGTDDDCFRKAQPRHRHVDGECETTSPI